MSFKNTISLSKTPVRALSTPPATPRVSGQLTANAPTNHGLKKPLMLTAPRGNNASIHAHASSSSRTFASTTRHNFTEYGEWDPSSPLRKVFNATKATTSNPPASSPISNLNANTMPQHHYNNPSGKIGVVISRGGRWSTRGGPSNFNHRLAFDKEIISAVLASPTDCIRVAAAVQGGRYNVDKWPNAEDVEGLALEVKWMKEGAEVSVLRYEGGEIVDWTEVEREEEVDVEVEEVDEKKIVDVEEEKEVEVKVEEERVVNVKVDKEIEVEMWEDARAVAVS